MLLGEGHHPVPASGQAACGREAIMPAMTRLGRMGADAVARRRGLLGRPSAAGSFQTLPLAML
eukprot:11831489-Heterocapsa_arctica.AAC.1